MKSSKLSLQKFNFLDISTFLLFTSKNSVRRISMDTDDMNDVHLDIVDVQNAVSIDFEFKSQRIFYSDVNSDKIFSANFDGSDLKVVLTKNLVTADGVAVDWVAKNLYLTDTGRNVIEVCRLNGLYLINTIDSKFTFLANKFFQQFFAIFRNCT